jgi:uncharacterized protein YjiS (DUF1127 family)
MSRSITKDELFSLLPANGSAETERARGQFLAAVRLYDALLRVTFLDRIIAWQRRRSTVATLEALPDAVLRDIGLHRVEIDHIAAAAAQRRTWA